MAQADTSIYNALLQPAKSALDWQNAYAAQDDARQARQMNALQLQSTQGKLQDESQARADQAAYRSMLRPGMTQDEQIAAAESSGNPYAMAQAQALRKARLESTKTTAEIGHLGAQTTAQAAIAGKNAAETQALQLKAETEKHDKAIGEIMSLGSPAEALESLRKAAAEGSIGQQEAQGISRQLMSLSTPEQWQQWQDQTLYKLQDAKGKAELQLKRLEYQLRRDNQVSEVANRNLIPGAAPGQFVPNAPLIEAKKQIAQAGATQVPGMTYMTDSSGNIVGLPTKAPLGRTVVANVVTDANRAPLPGKDGSMTEDQGKAAGWLVQATNAFANMSNVIKADPSAMAPGAADVVAGIPGLSGVGNAMRSEGRQKFNQSASSLSEALLRAATGAGVNRDEAAQKIQELTPVWGEKPGTTQQKLDAIPLYIESLKARAGRAGTKAAGQALDASGVAAPAQAPGRRTGTLPRATTPAASGASKIINFEDL